MSVDAASGWGSGPGSRRVTSCPRSRSSSAAVTPKIPAPTTNALMGPASFGDARDVDGAGGVELRAPVEEVGPLDRLVAPLAEEPGPELGDAGAAVALAVRLDLGAARAHVLVGDDPEARR